MYFAFYTIVLLLKIHCILWNISIIAFHQSPLLPVSYLASFFLKINNVSLKWAIIPCIRLVNADFSVASWSVQDPACLCLSVPFHFVFSISRRIRFITIPGITLWFSHSSRPPLLWYLLFSLEVPSLPARSYKMLCHPFGIECLLWTYLLMVLSSLFSVTLLLKP